MTATDTKHSTALAPEQQCPFGELTVIHRASTVCCSSVLGRGDYATVDGGDIIYQRRITNYYVSRDDLQRRWAIR